MAAGAALGATAAGHGQIVNLTASSFSPAPSLSFTLDNVNPGQVGSPFVSAHIAFHVNSLGASAIFKGTLNNHTFTNSKEAWGRALIVGGSSLQLAHSNANVGNLALHASVKGRAFGSASVLLKTQSTGALEQNFKVGVKRAGSFNAGATGYVGFRRASFVSTSDSGHPGSHYYYGWLRVKVTADGNGRLNGIMFVADANGVFGAYNSAKDGAINVGDVAAIPEPSSAVAGLGLLALGAAGVREFRRRRQAAA